MILPTMTHTRRFYLSSGTRQRRSLGKKGFPGRGWLCLRSPGPSPSGLHRGLRRMEEEFLAKMQLSRSELAFPGRTLVIKMRKAWSCAMADTRVGEMEGAWGRERPHCLGFRREPPCPLRCWKSQKASRRGSRSAGPGRQDLGARDASPATVCLNTSGCFFRQFLFTVFIDWRGEGSASALPPAGSLSSPAGPRARHRGKLLLLRPRQGKVRRCCQSGRLAPGRIRAGSSDRRENTTASLRGQPARSRGFREPPKLLGRKGTHSSQLVSQRDSYALAPTLAGNRDVGGVSPNPALHLAGLWRPFRRHFHVHQACHPPNSLRDVDRATAATSTALWERNA